MSYKIIKGEFHLYYQSTRHVGSRPDGDSMWFKPNNPAYLANLGGRDVNYNKGGFAQLRFEGIDALELHYKGCNHQRVPECVDARDFLLGEVGFSNIIYAPSATCSVDTAIRTADQHPQTGYILSRNADVYGRPVAFVFTGNSDEKDGDDVWLDSKWVRSSLNAKLMKNGQVYPAFYAGLPTDLRNELIKLGDRAQKQKKGMWAVDTSMVGAQIQDAMDLETHAIWSKLYRRLFSFFASGQTQLGGFDAWIRDDADRDDEVWIISIGELGNMHDIISVSSNTISMKYPSDDLVIVPK